jgi:hypothetical protein
MLLLLLEVQRLLDLVAETFAVRRLAVAAMLLFVDVARSPALAVR